MKRKNIYKIEALEQKHCVAEMNLPGLMAVGYLFEDVRLGGIFPDLVGEVVQPVGLLWSSTFHYLLWATSSGGCAVVRNALAARLEWLRVI